MLQELGVGLVQEAVFHALARDPYAGLDELAELVGRTTEEVVADVEMLRMAGLVRSDDSVPAGVATTDVTAAMAGLVERIEQDLARQHQRVVELKVQIAAGGPRPSAAGSASGGVEEVHGVERVRERIAELSFFTRESVAVIAPARPVSAESAAAARPLDVRSVRRGLDVRVVHDAALADDPAAMANLRGLLAAGNKVRLAPGPLQRLILLDERIAVVPLDPEHSARGAVVVENPGIVAALRERFERTWTSATELSGAARTEPGDAPDPQDTEVLALLAQGCTDEVTARKVGMSGRNVRRRVARLMEQLDATSRFAAGVAAARRGWV